MSRTLLGLMWRTVVTTAAAVLLTLALALMGLVLPLPLPIALGLLTGAAWWFLHVGADRAEPSRAPRLDLDADYALPHAQDVRVRRLEDLIHGAQPHRRMTGRGLALVLANIADERARDPDAPPLGPELSELLRAARAAEGSQQPFPPIDRRALHRYLDELAPREERPR